MRGTHQVVQALRASVAQSVRNSPRDLLTLRLELGVPFSPLLAMLIVHFSDKELMRPFGFVSLFSVHLVLLFHAIQERPDNPD